MTSLPAPSPWTAALPEANPPEGMALYQLPTGTYDTRAALAVRGGSFRDKRHFAANAVLVTHPGGDFLIDAGFGEQVDEHVKMLPLFTRAPYTKTTTVYEQLVRAGYDFTRLRGVILTHSHWDHSSGLDSLDVPIWINKGEREYAAKDGDGKVFRTVSVGHKIHEYVFGGPAYLGFAKSFDVYGDGSLVIALAGGHTTGSVVVFVTLPSASPVASGKRYAFIGDLTWQYDGIKRRAERPWLLRTLADSDAGQVREGIVLAAALVDVMRVVPAHDVGAYDGIPVLPRVMPS
ncbi:MBL fold metallo-hydrolase [Subtercola lobariae]|uniref:MBL fold metallo-hydrolase n=2 Tax=Subtercola lobariae TaxID=1588641 RepID=A0A917F4A1_9MICO|nr:MBL fold metallo-hydrolase [Subtercola lobariae]GGF41214.1 MBL fold metallo-hydrolase [Subtercola lobariae]